MKRLENATLALKETAWLTKKRASVNKNRILKTVAAANGISMMFFACCADSESWIPWIVCMANAAYLLLFGYANEWFDLHK